MSCSAWAKRSAASHSAGRATGFGDDQHFGGTGDCIDADLAEYQTLGSSDVGIAWTDNLVDGGHTIRTIGEGRDGLCAAHPVGLCHAGNMSSGQDQRVQLVIRGLARP